MTIKYKKLSEICNLQRGASPRPKGDPRFYGGSIPRLTIRDMTRDGKYVTPKIDFLTEEGARLGRFTRKGNLVMSISGTVGSLAFLSVDSSIHDGFVVFSDISEDYDKDFLYYYLRNFNFESLILDGGIFKNLTTDIIKNIDLPIISLELQNKIKGQLKNKELRLEKIKNLLEKIEIRNQYYIEKILTGEYKVNNGKIIKTTKKDNVFKKEYLKNLFELRMGETILRDRVLCYCPDENFIPVYSATEESKIFGYVKRDDVKKILTANDLILSARGSIGFLKITDEIKTSTQTTIQMVSKSDFSTYLVFKYLQLNRKKFFVAEGAAIPQITIESIKNIEIPIFDNNEIELFLKKLDLEKEKIEKLLSLEEQRFEWLSDKLLSGEYIIED